MSPPIQKRNLRNREKICYLSSNQIALSPPEKNIIFECPCLCMVFASNWFENVWPRIYATAEQHKTSRDATLLLPQLGTRSLCNSTLFSVILPSDRSHDTRPVVTATAVEMYVSSCNRYLSRFALQRTERAMLTEEE
jgi:hypothetical protein